MKVYLNKPGSKKEIHLYSTYYLEEGTDKNFEDILDGIQSSSHDNITAIIAKEMK